MEKNSHFIKDLLGTTAKFGNRLLGFPPGTTIVTKMGQPFKENSNFGENVAFP